MAGGETSNAPLADLCTKIGKVDQKRVRKKKKEKVRLGRKEGAPCRELISSGTTAGSGRVERREKGLLTTFHRPQKTYPGPSPMPS